MFHGRPLGDNFPLLVHPVRITPVATIKMCDSPGKIGFFSGFWFGNNNMEPRNPSFLEEIILGCPPFESSFLLFAGDCIF